MICASAHRPHFVGEQTACDNSRTALFCREICEAGTNRAAPNVTEVVSSRDGNARKKCMSHRNDAIALRARLMSGAVTCGCLRDRRGGRSSTTPGESHRSARRRFACGPCSLIPYAGKRRAVVRSIAGRLCAARQYGHSEIFQPASVLDQSLHKGSKWLPRRHECCVVATVPEHLAVFAPGLYSRRFLATPLREIILIVAGGHSDPRTPGELLLALGR